jgi:hypothetical protein
VWSVECRVFLRLLFLSCRLEARAYLVPFVVSSREVLVFLRLSLLLGSIFLSFAVSVLSYRCFSIVPRSAVVPCRVFLSLAGLLRSEWTIRFHILLLFTWLVSPVSLSSLVPGTEELCFVL